MNYRLAWGGQDFRAKTGEWHALPKRLIAIDDGPIAAHAAEVGMELALTLKAQVALIYAIDPSLTFAPETGVPADELARLTEQDATRLMANFRSRLPAKAHVAQFIPVGSPESEDRQGSQGMGGGSAGDRQPRPPRHYTGTGWQRCRGGHARGTLSGSGRPLQTVTVLKCQRTWVPGR